MFLTVPVGHNTGICYQLVEYIMTRSILVHISTAIRNKETHSLTHVGFERGKGNLTWVMCLFSIPPLHTVSSTYPFQQSYFILFMLHVVGPGFLPTAECHFPNHELAVTKYNSVQTPSLFMCPLFQFLRVNFVFALGPGCSQADHTSSTVQRHTLLLMLTG